MYLVPTGIRSQAVKCKSVRSELSHGFLVFGPEEHSIYSVILQPLLRRRAAKRDLEAHTTPFLCLREFPSQHLTQRKDGLALEIRPGFYTYVDYRLDDRCITKVPELCQCGIAVGDKGHVHTPSFYLLTSTCASHGRAEEHDCPPVAQT